MLTPAMSNSSAYKLETRYSADGMCHILQVSVQHVQRLQLTAVLCKNTIHFVLHLSADTLLLKRRISRESLSCSALYCTC